MKEGLNKIGTLNLILILVGAFFIWFNGQILCTVIAATIDGMLLVAGSGSKRAGGEMISVSRNSWMRNQQKRKAREWKMNDIVFEVIKVVVMVAVLVTTRYLVPCLKEKIGVDRLALAEKWARYAVLKAQQVLCEKSGQDRKTYVTKVLKEILIAKNIALSNEQLDLLIEAAVKQMKIEENAAVRIEAADDADKTTE